MKRVHIFLDNASNTNKNAYMIAWALEMVQHEKFDVIRISFMIPGHTKFAPDLFSKVSKSYGISDVILQGHMTMVTLYVDGEMLCQSIQSYLVCAAYMISSV